MWSLICPTFHISLPPHYKFHSNYIFHTYFLTQLPNYRHSFNSTHLRSKVFRNGCPHLLLQLPQCSFSKDNNHLGFDPSEDFFGLDVDLPPRDKKADASEARSWFGPNGQYIKELPCPSCRGRGYTPCTMCGIERSNKDCSLCSGKGIITCQRCLGERVIWEEKIDEKPWEKARSISPLKMKEDDEVDNLELNLDVKKKSKRVYRSPPPEVGLKISRSLKSLNAKTGLFSKRMQIIHRDPALHAQRVAAIKKAKGMDTARRHASETMKTFFSDPENRRKRSISKKGVKFVCKNCGREGHRKFYCPEIKEETDKRFKCRLCGERGHNKRTCQKSKTRNPNHTNKSYRCRVCGEVGHNRRTCSVNVKRRNEGNVRKAYRCRVCNQEGHNRRTCSKQSHKQLDIDAKEHDKSLKLGL